MIGTAMMKRNVSRSRLNCSHSLRSSATSLRHEKPSTLASLHAEHVDEDVFEARRHFLPGQGRIVDAADRGFEGGAIHAGNMQFAAEHGSGLDARQVPHAAGDL